MRSRFIAYSFAVLFLSLAACGSSFPELCETVDPLPPECVEMCDPSSAAPDTCPPGFHCTPDGTCGFQCTAAGGECGDGNRCTVDGRCIGENTCEGLECAQVECTGGGTTSVSGTVYAPNGTIPLSGVTVYVPNAAIAPFDAGLTCDQCGDELSGQPLVQTVTGTDGRFVLTNVPATDDVPLVMQVGRWRRQIQIPDVPDCVDSALTPSDTRLPRNKGEGDIPRMALSTGGADALECLIRKIGIDDAEITTPAGTGRLHLFDGNGTARFDSANGGMAFPDATELWADQASLSAYDIVFLSCEGGQNEGTKPQSSLAALKAYADVGGRVFASHWHNIWLERSPPWAMPTIDRVDLPDLGAITANVNQTFSRGAELAQWLVVVGASTVLGRIDLVQTQHTVRDVLVGVDKWITYNETATNPSIQYLAFTTPLEVSPALRCGRVVFSDIHVAADDSAPGLEFPSDGCTTNVGTLTPQEKVLLFMIFDIASCIPDVID